MTWNVTQKGDSNNLQIDFKGVQKGWEQWVMLLADEHLDNAMCNRALLRRHLDKANKRNAPVIRVGDKICGMQGRDDKRRSRRGFDSELSKANYWDAVVDQHVRFDEPYAHLYALFGKGNHEKTVEKYAESDLLARIAYRLGARDRGWPIVGGYGGWVRFQFHISTQNQSLLLKYYHGSGGGGPVTKGVIGTNRRGIMYPQADIIATGHIHEAWVVETWQEEVTARLYTNRRKQVHVQLPTYKDEYGSGDGGWHVERGAPPKPLGCAWVRFWYDSGGKSRRIKFDVTLDTE